MDRFEVTIAGAGVIGLAIAHVFTSSGRFKPGHILLVEQENRIGQHISSRHSEVIHAGIYYPPGSLKARCCVRGKALLYEFCDTYGVSYKKLGKLIISNDLEAEELEKLAANAEANGVTDLQRWDAQRLLREEPALRARHALLSPSTGILDSHAYMERLLQLSRDRGMVFAPNTRITSVLASAQGLEIVSEASNQGPGSSEFHFTSDLLINACGLQAQEMASRCQTLDPCHIPALYPCKGDYFSYSGRNPFKHLIYPIPEPNLQGLGIHSTQDLAGQLRFGPDSQYVESLDYDVDASKATRYAMAIRRYFPGIEESRLQPAYAGIRPKLSGPGQTAADFQIASPAEHGQPGLVELFGIESPGLTSSLALAEKVLDLV